MGKVIKVSGPLVVADGMADANMADVVRVGLPSGPATPSGPSTTTSSSRPACSLP